MARREAQAAFGHKVEMRIVRRRQMRMHRVHHRLILVRAGDGEHLRMRLLDHIRLGAKTAGDDHPSIRLDRLADGRQALIAGGIEKAAGVDQHEVCARIIRRDLITLGA